MNYGVGFALMTLVSNHFLFVIQAIPFAVEVAVFGLVGSTQNFTNAIILCVNIVVIIASFMPAVMTAHAMNTPLWMVGWLFKWILGTALSFRMRKSHEPWELIAKVCIEVGSQCGLLISFWMAERVSYIVFLCVLYMATFIATLNVAYCLAQQNNAYKQVLNINDSDETTATLLHRRRDLCIALAAGGLPYIERFFSHQNTRQNVETYFTRHGVTWPNGTNALTPVFDMYDDALNISWYITTAAYGCVFLALFVDMCGGIACSKYLTLAAFGLYIGSVVAPLLPNYLSATHFIDAIPKCTAKFDFLMDMIVSNAWGLCMFILVSVVMIATVLIVIPALMRVTNNIKSHDADLQRFFQLIPTLTCIITYLPLLFFSILLKDIKMFYVICAFLDCFVN